MSPPSTTRPADAFAAPYTPGRWVCRVCQPNVVGKGGESVARVHYLRRHLRASYDTPKPAGFVPPVRTGRAA
jgi:hypothetical protein